MRYKWKSGQWAFVLHRVSGVALSFYLIMHIYVVSSLYDPQNFDTVMAFLNQPLFKILEIGLLAAVVFHGLNGIRVMMIDFANATRVHAQIFWVVLAVSAVLIAVGAVPFLMHAGVLGH